VRELSLHILDLVENSLAAGATEIEVMIEENLEKDRLTIIVSDNGRGMDAETARKALDPFFTTRTTRHVGLGLPLLKAAAERCDGRLTLESKPGKGTKVTVEFRRSHIDRAPLGNMPATLLTMLLSQRPVDIRYIHRLDGRQFMMDTREFRSALGEVPLSHPQVRGWLLDYIKQGEESLYKDS